MNLWKATGTIGGLTMVSRILGFAREMIFARVMGAGMAADAFALAFLIPNLFRRLFGEGAFSQGFVPLFSQRMNGEGGMEEAKKFALATWLTRITFPYLIFISLVSLFSGILNSLTRFTAAAFAPALLNLALIAALLAVPDGGPATAQAMAIAVIAGGIFQLGLCWAA